MQPLLTTRGAVSSARHPVSNDADGAASPGAARTWAPFRVAIFRSVWLAALVSNLGSWMHLVAASWLMTSLTASAAMVALLQTANAAPGAALALPAGAFADVFDRRRLIMATQALQLGIAGALAALTLADLMAPALLIGLTVLLGAAATAGLPAYAAITPELVPRGQLPAAISLNSITVTASQAVGPAMGGVLVAALGPGAVFALNAVSFLGVLTVIKRWRRTTSASGLPPEHILSAIRTGLRYAANAPELRTVLIRALAYVVAFSSLPALLAINTRARLGGSAADYGLLLGMVGLGGISAAVLLPRFRARLSTDRLVVAATAAHAAAILAVSSLHSVAAVAPVMIGAGVAQMTVMSSLNIAAQEVLPAWVRGRGLATFQFTFQLGFAAGAAGWGAYAASHGVAGTLSLAALAMLITCGLAPRYRLDCADGVDVRPAYRPEPHATVTVDADDGPVLVEVEYSVARDELEGFKAACRDVRRARRRDGALQWALYEDLERPETHIESFLVASWTEHQRQGERQTMTDRRALDRVLLFHRATGDPRKRYLLGHHFHPHVHYRGRVPMSGVAHAVAVSRTRPNAVPRSPQHAGDVR